MRTLEWVDARDVFGAMRNQFEGGQLRERGRDGRNFRIWSSVFFYKILISGTRLGVDAYLKDTILLFA